MPHGTKGFTYAFRAAVDPIDKHPIFDELGIDPETVKAFGCGTVRRRAMANYIVFPIHEKDIVVAAAAQNMTDATPNYVFEPAKADGKVLLNVHRAVEVAKNGR